MKANKHEKQIINEANAVIHRRNLYISTPDGNRRVVNAHMSPAGPVVEDLHSGVNYDLLKNQFADGYGQPVIFVAPFA
jgi:hypothetical protein